MSYIGRLNAIEQKRRFRRSYIPTEIIQEVETVVSESVQHSKGPSKLDTLTGRKEIIREIERILYNE